MATQHSATSAAQSPAAAQAAECEKIVDDMISYIQETEIPELKYLRETPDHMTKVIAETMEGAQIHPWFLPIDEDEQLQFFAGIDESKENAIQDRVSQGDARDLMRVLGRKMKELGFEDNEIRDANKAWDRAREIAIKLADNKYRHVNSIPKPASPSPDQLNVRVLYKINELHIRRMVENNYQTLQLSHDTSLSSFTSELQKMTTHWQAGDQGHSDGYTLKNGTWRYRLDATTVGPLDKAKELPAIKDDRSFIEFKYKHLIDFSSRQRRPRDVVLVHDLTLQRAQEYQDDYFFEMYHPNRSARDENGELYCDPHFDHYMHFLENSQAMLAEPWAPDPPEQGGASMPQDEDVVTAGDQQTEAVAAKKAEPFAEPDAHPKTTVEL